MFENQRKSLILTLRAKREMFTYLNSGQKFKNGQIWRFFLETGNLRSNSVTRQVTFNSTKIGGKCQISKTQMQHFEEFSNNVEVF